MATAASSSSSAAAAPAAPNSAAHLDTSPEALLAAVSDNDVPKVLQLLENGADVNAAGEYGRTALQEAANWAMTPLVKLLIEHNADVNAVDYLGGNALMAAVSACRKFRIRGGSSLADAAELLPGRCS
jgi:ankyrin repeat protein